MSNFERSRLDNQIWILELNRVDTERISLALYEKEHLPTVKTINYHDFDLKEINNLNKEIIHLINKVDNQMRLSNATFDELKKSSHLLFDLIFPHPIKEKLIEMEEDDNLVLALDERLVDIMWEYLFDGKEFLGLKFNLGRILRSEQLQYQPRYRGFSRSASTESLDSARDKLSRSANPFDRLRIGTESLDSARDKLSRSVKMLILANPTGDLRSAYEEGLFIKNYLTKSKKIKVDFKAQDINSNYVKKNLRDYDIIHYAGHVEFDRSHPQQSCGLVLSDGWITAKEILVMGQTGLLPSIIFANACQSGRITQDLLDEKIQKNIASLASAFLFSGVRHFIGTFFRIEDTKSKDFAQEFYNQLTGGNSLGGAVRQARLKLIELYGISCITWLSYVLYGEPSFQLFPPRVKRQTKKGEIFTHLARIVRYKRRISTSTSLSTNSKRNRRIGLFCAGFVFVIAAFVLFKILPTTNPKTYILFQKTQKLYQQGNNREVVSHLKRIIASQPTYLAAYKLLGDVYFRMGEQNLSLQAYFDLARFSEKKKDHHNLATAYIQIAWTKHMWGDYPDSLQFYEKALKLSRKYNDKLHEADTLGRLAIWHSDKGNKEEAFSLVTKALEINRQRKGNPQHRLNLAYNYFNLGFVYEERDDYVSAKEFFNKSKELFESLKAEDELSDYYFDVGEIALIEKDYDLAWEFYQKGLALDRQFDHRFNLSSDYWMIGEYFWEIKRYKEAEEYFKEAIFLCRTIKNLPVLAGVYYDLGLMYEELGRKFKAKEYLQEALQLYKNIDTPDYQEVKQAYLSVLSN